MFEAQIQAGAKLLEEKVGPDWFKKIDLQRLEMFNCYNCVLGQIFGEYWDGLTELEDVEEGVYVSAVSSIDFARACGFSTMERDGLCFDQLTQEWMDFISLLVHGEKSIDA